MSNLFAMKYKINNGDWVIATDKTSEINVLGDFCYHNNATESPLVTYGSIGYVFKNRPESESDGLLLVGGAVFQGFTEQGGLIYAEGLVHHTEVGENTIIIKKMTEQELQQINTDDLTPTDIFDWLKQKIKDTKDVPEGFELPVVSENSITLISQAKITVSQELR